MRPYSKDKTVPAPFHTAKAHKKARNDAQKRARLACVSNAEVNAYMKEHGIRTATARARRKIASLIRKGRV